MRNRACVALSEHRCKVKMLSFEDINVTTMTGVVELACKVDIDALFPLLPVMRVEIPKSRAKRIQLPYHGYGTVLHANYMDWIRGTPLSRKSFRNVITLIVGNSSKNVVLKLSDSRIQICGLKSSAMMKESAEIVLEKVRETEKKVQTLQHNREQFLELVEWVKSNLQSDHYQDSKEKLLRSIIADITPPTDLCEENEDTLEEVIRRAFVKDIYKGLDASTDESFDSMVEAAQELLHEHQATREEVLHYLDTETPLPENYHPTLRELIDDMRNEIAQDRCAPETNGKELSYEDFCDHLEWLSGVKTVIKEGILEISNMESKMVNYNYNIGVPIIRSLLAEEFNKIGDNLSAIYQNVTDAGVRICLNDEDDNDHKFIVYRSGHVTQSSPNEETAKGAYETFSTLVCQRLRNFVNHEKTIVKLCVS